MISIEITDIAPCYSFIMGNLNQKFLIFKVSLVEQASKFLGWKTNSLTSSLLQGPAARYHNYSYSPISLTADGLALTHSIGAATNGPHGSLISNEVYGDY